MKRTILMVMLLSGMIAEAQQSVDCKFPMPTHVNAIKAYSSQFLEKKYDYLMDSMYFYKDDFQSFNVPSEIRQMTYKQGTDSLSNIDIYYNSAASKTDAYYMAHTIKYSSYIANDMNYVQEIFYDIDGQGNLQYDSRITYAYNSKGKLVSNGKELYFTDIAAWSNNRKYEYEYDAQGQIDKVYFYMGDDWNNAVFYEQYYYRTTAKIDRIERMTPAKNGKSDLLYRRTYNYDTNDVLLSLTDEKYMSGTWVFDYGVDFTYDDAKENLIAKETSSGFKFTYAYDNSLDIEDVKAPLYHYFDDYLLPLFKHPVIQSEAYLLYDGSWDKVTVKVFTYKSCPDAIDDSYLTTDNSLVVYPNPVHGNSFTIAFDKDYVSAQMLLTDSRGEVVMQSQVCNNENISIAQLRNGVYFMQLKHKGTITVEKIIINR